MRLLIVEDDPLLARPLARALEVAGHSIVGTPGSVAAATTAVAETVFDAVILDANLRRQSAAPVAAALKAQGIPFVVVSGYDTNQLEGSLSGAPFLSKQFSVDDLLTMIEGFQR